MKNYRKLKVWHKAYHLALHVYQITKRFPKEEIFGLPRQMRRAAVSISSNIAEGYGRNTEKDLLRFLHIAAGSACELESQILISRDLAFSEKETSAELLSDCEEVRKMLAGMIRKLASKGDHLEAGSWKLEAGS